MREPDEIIGSLDDPYMKRWILFKPRPFKRIARVISDGIRKRLEYLEVPKKRTYLPSVYLHEFKRSDHDRHFHDHVSWSISIVLTGGYWELIPDCNNPVILARTFPEVVPAVGRAWKWRRPGSITFRRAHQPHIIALDYVFNERGERIPSPHAMHKRRIRSLWIRGPWRREWGFYTPAGWVKWDEYDERGEYVYTPKGA